MDRIKEINRIRALLKSTEGRTAAVNADLPPAPEIKLVVDRKLKLSQVPESGLEVTLEYSDFRSRDRVVFNLVGESPEHSHEIEWVLDGPGVITTTVPKAFLEQLLGGYALALYFIYRPGNDQVSNWKFFDVIA